MSAMAGEVRYVGKEEMRLLGRTGIADVPKNQRSSSLEELSERNRSNCGRLFVLLETLKTLRNRTLGGTPEKTDNQARPIAAGIIREMAIQAEDTMRVIEQIETVVDELTGL